MDISIDTKSHAYRFIKSLMADGSTGEEVHKLISIISDELDPEIGGTILMDLIANRDDTVTEQTWRKHWFGPVPMKWYHALANAWGKHAKKHSVVGFMRYGNDEEWTDWIAQTSNTISPSESERLSKRADRMIVVVEYLADPIEAVDHKNAIKYMFQQVKDAIKDED